MSVCPPNSFAPSSALPRQLCTKFFVLALILTASLAAAPAPEATSPEAQTAPALPAIRTHFANGDPINDFLTALSVRYGILVIQPQDLRAFILQDFDLPSTAQDTLTLARQTLEPQGYSFVQSMSNKNLVIRIMTTAEAKKARLAQSPVSFGNQGETVDISDPTRPITHMMPINRADMADALRRNAAEDKEVTAEITGGNQLGTCLIIMGPALKVQQAVEKVAKLDRLEGGPAVVRVLTLHNLDAQSLATALTQSFLRENTPVKVAADARSNSVVLSGPEDKVLEVMVGLVLQETRAGRGTSDASPTPAIPPLPPTASPLPGPTSAPASQSGARAPAPQLLDEITYLSDNTDVVYTPNSVVRPRAAEGSLGLLNAI
jgi:type II secretory pathway component GspD/PulD (secretin)